jgi:FtsZ-interacting cell division protein ZipA
MERARRADVRPVIVGLHGRSGMEAMWGIATIGGPIILGALLVFGVWRNRRRRGQVAAERRGAGQSDKPDPASNR